MTDTVADSTAPAPDLSLRQRAWLLDQLARGPAEGLAQGEANAKLPAAVKKELMLDSSICNRLRAELLAEGLLRTEKVGRKQLFLLTDPGRAYLEQHRSALPSMASRPTARGMLPPSSDRVRASRLSFLLMQLFQADGHTLPQEKANRFGPAARKLELNAPTAKALRHEMAEQGLLTLASSGRTETYTLTPEGRLKLGRLAFADDVEFKLPGRQLNDLLEAARESAREFDDISRPSTPAAAAPPVAPSAPLEPVQPDSARLHQEILGAFAELARDQHGSGALVPIHAVRAAVRRQMGEEAARHEVFDPAVLALRLAGRLRLVPITDATHASPEALSSSIPGLGETLFFLEAAGEPVAHGSPV